MQFFENKTYALPSIMGGSNLASLQMQDPDYCGPHEFYISTQEEVIVTLM